MIVGLEDYMGATSRSEVVAYALRHLCGLYLTQNVQLNSVALRHPILLQLQSGQWNPSDHIVA